MIFSRVSRTFSDSVWIHTGYNTTYYGGPKSPPFPPQAVATTLLRHPGPLFARDGEPQHDS